MALSPSGKPCYAISMKIRSYLLLPLFCLLPAGAFAQASAVKRAVRAAEQNAARNAARQSAAATVRQQLPAAAQQALQKAATNARMDVLKKQLEDVNPDDVQEISLRLGVRIKERSRVSAAMKKTKPDPAKFQTNPPKKHKKTHVSFDRERAVADIVTETHSFKEGLQRLRILQAHYAATDFFQLYAAAYYRRHFTRLTPHLYDFFGKVSRENDPALEERLADRIQFLADNKLRFAQQQQIPDLGKKLRLRYLRNVSEVSAENFNEKDLVYSFERRLDPADPAAVLRHVTATSVFKIDGRNVPVYRFNQHLKHLPQLYRFLLAPDTPKSRLYAVVDYKSRNLAIYNTTRKLWLRVSPHEFANRRQLHLHLNQQRSLPLTLENGQTVQERVLWNLSIPIDETAARGTADLYQKFVLEPVELFRKDPRVVVTEGTIF